MADEPRIAELRQQIETLERERGELREKNNEFRARTRR
jgi:hypothetical protein